jgi:serine protease Do
MKKLSLLTILVSSLFLSCSFVPTNVSQIPSWTKVAKKTIKSLVYVEVGYIADHLYYSEYEFIKSGSGLVVGENGEIMTNKHVVNNISKYQDVIVTVKFENEKEYIVKYIKYSEIHDIAILKINAKNLPILDINDIREPELGEPVLSLGNPAGFKFQVFSGIISATSVKLLPEKGFIPGYGLIQMTADVNPGCSGGPTVDRFGKLIGINQLKAVQLDGIQWIIPAKEVQNAYKEILESSDVTYLKPVVDL